MVEPRYDAASDSGSESGEESSIYLGLADGPLQDDDEENPLVSRIGGRPAWLPLQVDRLPPASLIDCKSCNKPMELLVELFAPLEDSPYDRCLLVWCCAYGECQRKLDGSVRAIRMLKYNSRWAAKLEKQRKRREDRENRLAELKKKEKEADAERSRREIASNPFTMSGTGSQPSLFGNGPLFGNGAQVSQAASSATQTYTSPDESTYEDSESDFDEDERIAEELAIKASLGEQHAQFAAGNNWAKNAPCYTPALYLNTIPEPARDTEDGIADTESSLAKIAASGTEIGSMGEEQYEQIRLDGIDPVFERFTSRLAIEPSQVIRYEWGGVPLPFTNVGSVYRKLWPNDHFDPSKIGTCRLCDAPRIFEAQLMPNIANLLRVNHLKGRDQATDGTDSEVRRRAEIASLLGIEMEIAGDTARFATGIAWSTAMIFVCSGNCCPPEGETWAEEVIAVQFEQDL
ncbi:hypothetical protein MYAM1_001048 [Malassezia yamatoensis]|uniref:Programmed cell death protein 2 C-terminal domain-containing protein n=1 Tax=Malassezia yamatoensis TaxID=253288 RepID=A0AAJ6CFH8_9BASI|nr:hypothetical protein MYAM1_001048 [Malassezia yamatoensis]